MPRSARLVAIEQDRGETRPFGSNTNQVIGYEQSARFVAIGFSESIQSPQDRQIGMFAGMGTEGPPVW